MRLDQYPLFRKVITPWYDGVTACWVVIVCMVVVALFSVAGIVVARSEADFHRHTWVPSLLLLLSLFVALSVGRRLVRRYFVRHAQTKEP